MFLPPAAGTVDRRVLSNTVQLAYVQGDPAAELIYSAEPAGNRGPVLLRFVGSAPALTCFGYVQSDIEKDSPAIFEPAEATSKYFVAKRTPKRIAEDRSAMQKDQKRQLVQKPAEQQKPVDAVPACLPVCLSVHLSVHLSSACLSI